MNKTPLWLWDISSADRLLAWMAKLQREAFIEAFTGLQPGNVHAIGTRATSSMERDC